MNIIFSHPAFQAICAGLLCAALVLHIWANETLGEVRKRPFLHVHAVLLTTDYKKIATAASN